MIEIIEHGTFNEYHLRQQYEPPKSTQQQKNAFYNPKLGRVQFVPKKAAAEAQADWYNILRVFQDVIKHPLEGALVVVTRLGWTHPASTPKRYLEYERLKITKPDNDNSEKMMSFCGFFPADNPRWVAVVWFRKPQSGHSAGCTALPTFADIVRALMVKR